MNVLYAVLVIFAINPSPGGGIAISTVEYSDAKACYDAAGIVNRNGGDGKIMALCLPTFYAK